MRQEEPLMLMATAVPVQSPITPMLLSADHDAAAHPARASSCMGAELPFRSPRAHRKLPFRSSQTDRTAPEMSVGSRR